MYCRNCGSELPENAKFCNKCGTAIGKGQQKTTVRPAPAPRSASTGTSDKIDVKLIAAVVVFLTVLLAVVIKVIPSRDAGMSPAGSMPGVDGVDEGGSADPYFGKELRVGGKVEFGRYEQDGDMQNGPEPIVWDVVASFEDGYLLVSRYILDGMPWDDGSGGSSALDLKAEITYEQSSMRRWIRDTFSAKAFTEEERSLIIPVSVKEDGVLAQKNNQYATDYAFILREDEVIDNWGHADTGTANRAIACAPTEYAAKSGLAVVSSGNARYRYGDNSWTAPWALRRRYTDQKSSKPKIVTVDTIGRFSNAVVSEILGFRPAIYIKF